MGLLAKLLRRRKQSGEMSYNTAVKIIQTYGAILEYDSPPPGSVADVKKLPYKKEQIKQALIIGLRNTNDNETREGMVFGFLELANWQENVGDNYQGLDVSKIDLKSDPLKAMEDFKKQHEVSEKWTPLVEAEREALSKELQDLYL